MNLNSPATVGLIVIALTPLVNFLSSLAKQEGWPKEANALVAIVISAIGGVACWYLTGSINGIPSLAEIVGSAGAIFLASQAVYAGFGFRNSWLDQLLAQWSVVKAQPAQMIAGSVLLSADDRNDHLLAAIDVRLRQWVEAVREDLLRQQPVAPPAPEPPSPPVVPVA